MQMTDVERRVVDFRLSQMQYRDLDRGLLLEHVKRDLPNVALHEAGHAVVGAFFDLLIDPVQLSIIPDRDTWGRMICYKIDPFWAFWDLVDKKAQRIKMEIMQNLAGDAAVMLINPEWVTAMDSDDEMAWKLAEDLVSKSWNQLRITKMLFEWTLDILDISTVWRCIEQISKELLKHGEIAECTELLRPISNTWMNYAIWRRRFSCSLHKSSASKSGSQ